MKFIKHGLEIETTRKIYKQKHHDLCMTCAIHFKEIDSGKRSHCPLIPINSDGTDCIYYQREEGNTV